MKKFLLSIFAVASVFLGASAFEVQGDVRVNPDGKAPAVMTKRMQKEASRAEDGYDIRFCGDPYTWVMMGEAYELRQVLYISPEIATQLAGNKITTIGFSACLENREYTNGKICVWEDPKNEGYPSTEVASKEITIKDSYTSMQHYQTGTFASADQYVIKEGTGFFFGFVMEATADDYPICVDGELPNSYAGYVFAFKDGEYLGYVDMAQLQLKTQVGSNLFLYAKTVGEKTGIENLFTVGGITIDDFALPIFNEETTPKVNLYIDNQGPNVLKDIEYSYTFEGSDQVYNQTGELNFPASTKAYVAIPVENFPEGRGKITLTVNKLNGMDLTGVSSSLPFINLGAQAGYDRKFVVEEGTGTWCGWCPRGIVGFEYMQSKYPEKFIGIAVHGNDKFAVPSYAALSSTFFDGYPSCVVNRDPVFVFDPNSEYLQAIYEWWENQVSPAGVDAKIEYDGTTLTAESKVTFAIDEENSDYRVAFVILEDGLIGTQTNFYAGGSNGVCGGWEKYKQSQTWEYKHTARAINTYQGIKNSIPATIKAGEEYTYSTGLSLNYVTDIENTQIVTLLIDGKTGTILNAKEVAYAEYGGDHDGIEGLENDNNAPAVYYNIQGVKVSNPQEGNLYIRVQGGKASKIVF